MGLDLSQARAAAANRPYPARFTERHLLAPPMPLGPPVRLDTVTERRTGGSAASTVAKAGTLHGVCLCFISTLAPGITLRNAPGDSDTTNFAHTFLPIEVPGRGGRRRPAGNPGGSLRRSGNAVAGHGDGRSIGPAAPGRAVDAVRRTAVVRGAAAGSRGLLPALDRARAVGAGAAAPVRRSTPAAALRAWLEANAGAMISRARGSRALLLKEAIARCG